MDVPANLECNCDSADETFRNAVSHQPAIGLPPPSRWCGKWPAIDRSSIFQTDPALYVPEASLPSTVPSTFTCVSRDDDVLFIGERAESR